MARKGAHNYAFEVKNATYYAYFPREQIDKLFRFLDQFIPSDNAHKHAVVAAHLGKRWLFKEISWADWEKNKIPDKVRILKRDRGNLNIDTATLNLAKKCTSKYYNNRQQLSFKRVGKETACKKPKKPWCKQKL